MQNARHRAVHLGPRVLVEDAGVRNAVNARLAAAARVIFAATFLGRPSLPAAAPATSIAPVAAYCPARPRRGLDHGKGHGSLLLVFFALPEELHRIRSQSELVLRNSNGCLAPVARRQHAPVDYQHHAAPATVFSNGILDDQVLAPRHLLPG